MVSLARQLQRLQNYYWEARLGVTTRGFVTFDEADQYPYSMTSYPAIVSVLRRVQPTPNDVLVDLGCGMGRVLACAARLPMREVVGVEMSEALCAIAQRNARKLRKGKTPIRIICGKAQAFDFSHTTILYMYNPFGRETLQQVLRDLVSSWKGTARVIRICYVNPVHEDVFAQFDQLERFDRWEPGSRWGLEHPVSFWSTVRG